MWFKEKFKVVIIRDYEILLKVLLALITHHSHTALTSKFNHLHATFINALELHTKEHRRNVAKHERLKAFHIHALHIPHLVIAIEHVNFRSHLHELRVRLVKERTESKHTIRALHRRLVIFRVIRNSRVRK